MWLGRPSLKAELDRPGRDATAGEPELEDFIEGLGKARNAHTEGDELTMRLALQTVAELCPSVLGPLNPPVLPGTRPEALKAALDLPNVPAGYRDDMLLCLGLSGAASSVDDLLAAGTRLVMGTLALLEANPETIAPLLAPNLPNLVADGTLRRYVEQE